MASTRQRPAFYALGHGRAGDVLTLLLTACALVAARL
jgi:hypothetical protein